MWMWYAEEARSKACDLQSAVVRLHKQFIDLEFDADHEMVYGLERWDSNDRIIVVRNRYRKGVKLCERFLNNSISIEYLLKRLRKIGLKEFIPEIEKFLKSNDRGTENVSKSKV